MSALPFLGGWHGNVQINQALDAQSEQYWVPSDLISPAFQPAMPKRGLCANGRVNPRKRARRTVLRLTPDISSNGLGRMNSQQLFHKSEEREFFAHHMLLHAAALEIQQAEAAELSRFNRCLAAMTMTALAVEALVNAVGSRCVEDWPAFERLRPYEKIDRIVKELSITGEPSKEPWTTLQFLGRFRNDIAHPKPEAVVKESVLPETGLKKTMFQAPRSALEREITLGNARRVYGAVHALKGIFTDALPSESRFGIYADMWSGSTAAA